MTVPESMNRRTTTAALAWLLVFPLFCWAQVPPLPPPGGPPPGGQVESLPAQAPGGSSQRPQQPKPKIVGVEIRGNQNVAEDQVRRHIRARPGIPFDPTVVRDDVKRLYSSRWFFNVRPIVQSTPQGVVLIYEVSERPTAETVKFVGNRYYNDKRLLKECGLKPGDSLNAYSLREAKRKIEELYRKAGMPETVVEIAEGERPQDKRAVFLVHEGKMQRIYKVEFEGNDPALATDGRLKTLIKTKPGILMYLFRGKFDGRQLDADVERLTAYYRDLGYFRARISRELEWSKNGEWVTVRFVIDEGPRYRIREVRFVGNEKFTSADLLSQLELHAGDYFDMAKLRRDEGKLRDIYGAQGYIFADIQANPRFAEEPGILDLVYKVNEGEQFRVGKIHVHIQGEVPHTKMTVVLNRLSLRPGDIIDIREVRASERRLKASSVFEKDPSVGPPPRIEIRPLNATMAAKGLDRAPAGSGRTGHSGHGGHGHAHGGGGSPTFRGQEPNGRGIREAVIDLFLPPLKR